MVVKVIWSIPGENQNNEPDHKKIIIVVSEVASFDGSASMSTLGDVSKCTYFSGNCKTPEATIVWSESTPFRMCKYERLATMTALLSEDHRAVPELRMFAAISQDMRFTDMEAKGLP